MARRKRKAKKTFVPKEQIAYANMINHGALAGITILAFTFIAYISGIIPSHIKPFEMSNYWHLSSDQFLKATGGSHGWEWLGMLHYGDYLSMLGIAWLAGLTIIAYLLYLIPAYFKQKDIPFLTIVVVEVIVLVVAASGILATAGY